jgi:hypothetical protein
MPKLPKTHIAEAAENIYHIGNFTGINQYLPPDAIADNEVQDCFNVLFDEVPGSIVTAKGSVPISTLPNSDTAKSIYVYKKTSGEAYIIAACKSGSVYVNRNLAGDWVKLFDGTPDTFYNFEAFEDVVWMTNGIDKIRIWDGRNLMTLDGESRAIDNYERFTPDLPPAKFVKEWQNCIWLANTTRNGSEIIFSRFYDEDGSYVKAYWGKSSVNEDLVGAWISINQILVAPEDNTEITGLAVYLGNLIVFKERAMYIIRGTGPQNYTIYRVPGEIRMIFPNTIAIHHNLLTFLTTDGIYTFNGNRIEKVSHKVDPLIETAVSKYIPCLYWKTDKQEDWEQGTVAESYPNVMTRGEASGKLMLLTLIKDDTEADFNAAEQLINMHVVNDKVYADDNFTEANLRDTYFNLSPVDNTTDLDASTYVEASEAASGNAEMELLNLRHTLTFNLFYAKKIVLQHNLSTNNASARFKRIIVEIKANATEDIWVEVYRVEDFDDGTANTRQRQDVITFDTATQVYGIRVRYWCANNNLGNTFIRRIHEWWFYKRKVAEYISRTHDIGCIYNYNWNYFFAGGNYGDYTEHHFYISLFDTPDTPFDKGYIFDLHNGEIPQTGVKLRYFKWKVSLYPRDAKEVYIDYLKQQFTMYGIWVSPKKYLGKVEKWHHFLAHYIYDPSLHEVVFSIRTALSQAELDTAAWHPITPGTIPNEIIGNTVWCQIKIHMYSSDSNWTTPVVESFKVQYFPTQYPTEEPVAVSFDNRYILAIAYYSYVNDIGIIWDKNKNWTKFYRMEYSSFAKWDDILLAGSYKYNKIFKMFEGYKHYGTIDVTPVITFKDFNFHFPANYKLLRRLHIVFGQDFNNDYPVRIFIGEKLSYREINITVPKGDKINYHYFKSFANTKAKLFFLRIQGDPIATPFVLKEVNFFYHILPLRTV